MKEMIFMSAQPDDMKFAWQIETFIENVRGLGYSNPIHVLVFIPHDRLFIKNTKWIEIANRYRHDNVKIFMYPDTGNLLREIEEIKYIPLLRPHILERHFEKYPELKEKAIFYHDSDIVFTKFLDFSQFLDDEINYLSDTSGYLNADYFDRKQEDTFPHLRQHYSRFDVLGKLSEMCGISRDICTENNNRTGGAQYLLKNIDSTFWRDVTSKCRIIRRFLCYDLGGVNRRFFPSENKGIQSWCADMWAVLWTLWERQQETQTPKELDFCWATDTIERWDNTYIYHDAGVVTTLREDQPQNDKYLFDKNYAPFLVENSNATPFKDFNFSHVSQEYASYKYTQELLKVKEKYYT